MLSDGTAISARGVSKQYVIRHEEKHTTLGEKIAATARNPFARGRIEMFQALQDVSFEAKKGDVVGIVGRNGAGKSTLLKILSRITEPTEGRIELRGRVGSLLEVGTGFHQELTGRENIFLNGAILGMRRREIQKQFDAIVEFAGVEKFLDTPVKRYSSGMYVRLAFAVAAHLSSEILVVDEVLAVGDADFQKKCMGKMDEVARDQGRTILFVSHNMAAVRALCKKGILLERGRVKCMGDVQTVVDAYASEGGSDAQAIVSFMTRCVPELKVESVTVNGSEGHVVQLNDESRVLDFEVKGELKQATRMDMEIQLTDMYDSVLGFFGAGHEYGDSPMREAGRFTFRRAVRLPDRVHKGEYMISLALTHHNVKFLAKFPRAVRVEVAGYPTATGRPLEYTDGKGFLSLEECTEALEALPPEAAFDVE